MPEGGEARRGVLGRGGEGGEARERMKGGEGWGERPCLRAPSDSVWWREVLVWLVARIPRFVSQSKMHGD